MPITNAGIGSFNLGKDCTIVLVGPFGTVQLDNVTGFQAQQQTNDVKVNRLDGNIMHAAIPSGWTVSFDNERGSSALDDLFAQTEAAWFQNGTISASQLYQYVTEVNGSTSTYLFSNAMLKLSNAGDWKGDQSTKQHVEGNASRRTKVS